MFHLVHERPYGDLSAHDIGDIHERAVLVHHDDGLEFHDLPDHGGASFEPAAAIEVHEVVHGEGVPDMIAELGDISGVLAHARALAPLFERVPGEHPETHARALGIYDDDPSFGEVGLEFVRRFHAGGVAPRHRGGEGEMEYVLARAFQDIRKVVVHHRRRHHGSRRRLARREQREKFVSGKIRPGLAVVLDAVDRVAHGHYVKIVLHEFGRIVGGEIGCNNIIAHDVNIALKSDFVNACAAQKPP